MRALVSYIVRVGFLCRKELLVLLADPQSRAMISPALLQSLLFGYGATYDLTNAPYAVLDLSRGAASTALLARVDGTGCSVGHSRARPESRRRVDGADRAS